MLFHHLVYCTEDFLDKIGSLFHTAESSRKGSYIIDYYEDCRGHLLYKDKGNGKRNFYFRIDKSCITLAYKCFTWDNIKVSDLVRRKLSNEQKKYLLSIGIKLPNQVVRNFLVHASALTFAIKTEI